MTPFQRQAVDKYVRVTGTQDKSSLNFRPDQPLGIQLKLGVVTWEEPKNQSNISHYIVRTTANVVFRKVAVGTVSVDGVDDTQVFVSSFNDQSGLESIQSSAVGTGVPDPPTPGVSGDPWSDYIPTTTQLTGVTSHSRAIQGGKSVFVSIEITGTSNGTNPTISLPFAPFSAHQTFACTITQGAVTVSGVAVVVGSTVVVNLYNNGALAAATVYTFRVQGVYEIA